MTGPKRFYKTVDVSRQGDQFAILLDGKPVRTPARGDLAVGCEALAREIAAEWSTQGAKIDPSTMPMTKRANTALDRVKRRETDVAADIVSYAGTDLLCYRADTPQALVDKQRMHWDPVLDWARRGLGASFEVQTGITHVTQPEASLDIVRQTLHACDFYALTPLHTITTMTGSALLALALAEGTLQPDSAWAAAHVDEDWQISQWGEDAEAKVRRNARRAEFEADVRFLELVRR